MGSPDRAEFHDRVRYFTESSGGRKHVERYLQRCAPYKARIEAELRAVGLPSEALAIVWVESACNPRAESPVGALGLWQFMPATARAYGLLLASDGPPSAGKDERMDPIVSTRAAARFIVELLRQYHSDWELALAAYNAGPSGVRRRLKNAQVGSFWGLVDAGALPQETAGYVPRVQALALVLSNLGYYEFSGSR